MQCKCIKKYANVRIKQSELVNRTGYTTNDILNIIQDLIKDGLFERLKIGKSKFVKHKIFKKRHTRRMNKLERRAKREIFPGKEETK